MRSRTRSRLDMGERALEFCEAHPDTSSGYTAAVASLRELLARSKQLEEQQRQGFALVRGATRRKRTLRRSIRQDELAHVANTARRAAKEVPELTQKFVLARRLVPYLAFRSLARSIIAEAEVRRDLLVKHGLSDGVFQSLIAGADQFEQALAEGREGRRLHIAATVELNVVAGDVVEVVKVIDGVYRVRFARDPDLLAAWRSASNVIGPARPAQKTEPSTEAPKSDAPAPKPGAGEPAA